MESRTKDKISINVPAGFFGPEPTPKPRPKTAKDSRQAPRTKVQWPVHVKYEGKTHHGVCKDISVIGLGAFGLPALPVGAEIDVCVEFGPLMTLDTTAVVVRQEPELNPPAGVGPRLITGMRFLRLNPAGLKALHQVLAP